MDPYLILQVDRTADAEVIRAAYRVLARRHHPDTGGDPARMAELNEAWGILGDPSRRARHDRARDQERVITAARAASADAMATVHGTPVMRPEAARDDGSRRAAPFTQAAPRPVRPATDSWSPAPSTDRPSGGRGDGTVLDFGRYVGWTISELGRHDPDYLMWLERTPAGRGLRAEIRGALERNTGAVATVARSMAPIRGRRSWFR